MEFRRAHKSPFLQHVLLLLNESVGDATEKNTAIRQIRWLRASYGLAHGYPPASKHDLCRSTERVTRFVLVEIGTLSRGEPELILS
jgi:hypothetical protein